MVQRQDAKRPHEFAEETVGSLMDFDFICVPETYTVGEAFKYLRKNVHGKANIHYSYVIDPMGVFVNYWALMKRVFCTILCRQPL